MRAPARPPVTLTCQQCSTAFTRKLSDVGRRGSSGTFCSRACLAANQRRGSVELTCKQCSTVFTRKLALVRPGGGFCSSACAGRYARPVATVTRTCGGCQATFEIPQSRARQGKGTYCSAACRVQPLPGVAVTVAPKRPLVKPKPGSITPKYLDRLPLIDGGSHVSCHRCERLRERGVRCVCERPMWDEVSA
jgi:hypothetical protein